MNVRSAGALQTLTTGSDFLLGSTISHNRSCLTRGGAGSVLHPRRGATHEHPGYPVPSSQLVDTIGAGDAFTAAVAVGLLRKLPLPRINDAANRLASYVCTQRGATPIIPPDLLAQLG